MFRLTAAALGVANGQVRCGRCGGEFNALARLAEDSGEFVEGESVLELEQRADSILEFPAETEFGRDLSGPEPATTDESGVEIAHLQFLDDQREIELSPGDIDLGSGIAEPPLAQTPTQEIAADELSLEFTLPPGEIDRIFIEMPRRELPLEAIQNIPPSTAPPVTAEPAPASTPPAPEPAVPKPAAAKPATPPPAPARPAPPAAAAKAPRAPAPPPKPPQPIADEEIEEFTSTLAGLTYQPPQRRWPWAVGAGVLGFLLAVQLIHWNRNWLAGSMVGGSVRALYGAMGLELPSAWQLDAYQLRQWGATGNPSAHGVLTIRASILNAARQAQPYPLLRVTLADRFGGKIGSRDFRAAEYMRTKPTRDMLDSGQRVDAIVQIADPGKDAEGFELDVCLAETSHSVRCASDSGPISAKN